MTENKQIEEKVYASFRKIDFAKRYKTIFETHNDYDLMITRMNKSKNLATLKGLGYNFKIFSPGQYYNFEEHINEIMFTISLKINKGFISTYVYIYMNDEKISISYNNFAFLYRYLMEDMEAKVTALAFKDNTELEEISKKLLGIYEDFKNEFLIQMNESN